MRRVVQPRRSPSPVSTHSPLSARDVRERKTSFSKASSGADLQVIEWNIADQLRQVKYHPEHSRQELFMVFKYAFNQLIESKAVVYKSILSQIKAEYEEFIDTLERGQSQTIYLQRMLKALLSEKENIRHFVQRGDELEEKMAKLKKHNAQLREKLHIIRAERARRLASAESKSMHSVVKETRLLIPGLSLKDLTDLPTLKKTLSSLEAQVWELKEATKSKFAERNQKLILKQQLTRKENVRDHVFANHEKSKEKCETLKVAVEVRSPPLFGCVQVLSGVDIYQQYLPSSSHCSTTQTAWFAVVPKFQYVVSYNVNSVFALKKCITILGNQVSLLQADSDHVRQR